MAMSDAMAIDEMGRGSEGVSAPVKKALKRKRAACTNVEETEVVIRGLEEEMEGLFGYYREVLGTKVEGMELNECRTSNGLIACLLEESELPMSKLVECVFDKLKEREGVSFTMTTVKSSVVLLGQRMAYGILNEDADVLEDETASCLWCWETRDIKMLPKSSRMMLKVRRTCRKKIHERITAVSATDDGEHITGFLSALRNQRSDSISKSYLMKRSEKLCKVLNEADIRLLVDSMIQKNGTELIQKEAMKEEKLNAKKLKKNQLELEKDKKRMDRETKKEKSLHEKEQKWLQEKAEKRWEKEEIEIRKQQKRLQDEAEKEQRRREKEDAELKKQLVLKKQASLMERFLKTRKTDCTNQNDQPATDISIVRSVNSSQQAPESIIQSIDKALAQSIELSTSDLQKSHMDKWHRLGQSIRSNGKQHWGLRRRPRTELIKEIKLSCCKDIAFDNDPSDIKLLKSLEDSEVDESKNNVAVDNSVHCDQKCYRRKQLLQFDKSFRPAFYGYWPKKSNIVGPRHPFKKDPELDYDVDSDEEWEEEEPGESLSDCEKDEEDESLEAVNGKTEEEDESEDDFFVPDGYLSEDEGIQDRLESDSSAEGFVSSSCQVEENEEFRFLLRHHKHLQNLTEQALRKNQPLFVLNLMHEKAPLLKADDLNGIQKVEQICFQALSMCLFPGHSQIEISVDETENEIMESTPNSKVTATLKTVESAISDADLPKFVSAIQSGSQGMTKIVEGLQQIFPCVPKSLLKSKVRQLSDFTDNRWQVKKEVLDDLGLLPPSVAKAQAEKPPADTGRNKKKRTIATFFLKRCLPPSDSPATVINPHEVSPQAPRKIICSVDLEPQLFDPATTDEAKNS